MRKTETDNGFQRIDNKHHIELAKASGGNFYPRIVKTTNGQPMPDDEPRILFRGRDKLALPMLKFYRELCVKDGCTDYQLESMDSMIAEFEQFATESTTMKQPGITKGA